MQQQIAVANDREDLLTRADAFGNAWCKRRVLQIGSIDQIVDGHQTIQIDRSADLVEIVIRQREMSQQKCRDVFGAFLRGFESHGSAITSLRQFAFDGAQQVVDFFVVDEQIAVARHSELPGTLDRHPAEQLRNERRNHGREKHEVGDPGRLVTRWQLDDAWQRAGHLYHRKLRIASECVLTRKSYDEVLALILYARKRARGIESERCEDGLDLRCEVVGKPCLLFRCERFRVDESDSVRRQRWKNRVVQQVILIFHQCNRALVDG